MTRKPADPAARLRERCSKIGCRNTAHIVVKVYSDGDPQFMAFCPSHIETCIDVIGRLNVEFYADEAAKKGRRSHD